MIRAVLFDLDDTLYLEGSYVRSGFACVAAELERRGVDAAGAIQATLEELHFDGGRERVFDRAVERIGFPGEWVPELVRVYRDHTPTGLQLAAEVPAVLRSLRSRFRIGCVTDGWAAIQRRKIRALGVEEYVEAIVVSDELGGREFWKPDPQPLLECCRRLDVTPTEAVFVGDNPDRDLAAARNANLLAIRIRRTGGWFRDAKSEEPVRGEIESLDELPAALAELEP